MHLFLKPELHDHLNPLVTYSNTSMTPNRVLEINKVAPQNPVMRCNRGIINILDGE